MTKEKTPPDRVMLQALADFCATQDDAPQLLLKDGWKIVNVITEGLKNGGYVITYNSEDPGTT